MDTRRLCELTSGADALDMKPLVDLASRALAKLIEGKTPEQIRSTFHLPDDLTEEEKLEPIKNLGDDTRIRLLNRLYSKRRKVGEACRREAGSGWVWRSHVRMLCTPACTCMHLDLQHGIQGCGDGQEGAS